MHAMESTQNMKLGVTGADLAKHLLINLYDKIHFVRHDEDTCLLKRFNLYCQMLDN